MELRSVGHHSTEVPILLLYPRCRARDFNETRVGRKWFSAATSKHRKAALRFECSRHQLHVVFRFLEDGYKPARLTTIACGGHRWIADLFDYSQRRRGRCLFAYRQPRELRSPERYIAGDCRCAEGDHITGR